MHFIDDIDLVLSLIGLESCLIDEVADIVDAIVRCSVDLDDIEHRPIIERDTIGALMAWISVFEIRTIDSLGEDTSGRGFTRSTRTREDIGVSDSVGREARAEDSRDGVLSDDRVPISRAVFGVERH